MSRQKQYQLQSRRNGLIIPIPAHNQGVIPRFGIEDNQMIFAPVDGSGRRAKIHEDNVPTVMGGIGGPERVVSGRSTLNIQDAEAPTAAPEEPQADEQYEKLVLAEAPVEAAPAPKPTRARKAATKATTKAVEAPAAPTANELA